MPSAISLVLLVLGAMGRRLGWGRVAGQRGREGDGCSAGAGCGWEVGRDMSGWGGGGTAGRPALHGCQGMQIGERMTERNEARPDRSYLC